MGKYTVAALMALAALGLAAPAQAGPLTASAVPWVQGRNELPHPALNGKVTMLQAVAEGGSCGGNYQYQWDINGDGDYADANEQLRNATSGGIRAGYYAPLGLDVQFANAPGDQLLFPKVRVVCGDEVATTVMPVKIYVDRLCTTYPANENCADGQNLGLTRKVHAERGIDRGLWWMFIRAKHRVDDGRGHDAHLCYIDGDGATPSGLFNTGQTLNAFLRRGHGHGPGRDSDIYYRHMTQCGIHSILATLTLMDLRFDDTAAQGRNAKGLKPSGHILTTRHYGSGYEGSAWPEPIASFGDPDYVSPVGADGVFGVNLRNIGQDVADMLAHCMGDNGGWHYSCRQNATLTSTNGWPPEAMRMLDRRLGAETYQWAKDAQRAYLNSKCSGPAGCAYGNSTYEHLAGNGLTGYGWTEDETYDPNNAEVHGLMLAAQSVNPFTGAPRNPHYGIVPRMYYAYSVTKGMRAFQPEIRIMPNGTDWHAWYTRELLNLQAADGHWTMRWCCTADYISTLGLTPIGVQILQTWLEVFANGRAFPQQTGPGDLVTFDHSSSYSLDPSVEMRLFSWNVIDYPNGLDLNGDGDFADNGEHAAEDLNGDGAVTGDEVVWDFETADANEQFQFAYNDDVAWGDVVRHGVTLAVTDNRGRLVYDYDSVQVEIALINHAPVVVPHPDGRDAVYRGYLGGEVVLDARASYDPDAEQDVFPGDGERPRGIADQVTSIHIDLNFDGEYTADENAIAGPVRLTLRENMAVGDLIAVPIRVCDDGQWNGECFDGPDQDCSMCAYGSAAIELVINREPPIIDVGTCDANHENCDPYVAIGFGGVPIDLSNTVDPEGVLGLRFDYELVEGRGRIELDPAYRGNDENMGPTFTYIPEPDGPRTDRVRVRVWDFGGLMSEAFVRINVPNAPPIIDDFSLQFAPLAPVVAGTRLENLGNGWYRLHVDAAANQDWSTRAVVEAHDPGNDDLVYQVDVDGNGRFDIEGSDAQPEFGNFMIPGGRAYTASLRVTDDADAVSTTLEFEPPVNNPTMQYFFDLGADGSFEVAGGAQAHYDFQADPNDDRVVVVGRVVDSNGQEAGFQANHELVNRAPVFEVARLLSQSGFDAVITASAVDPDDDQVTYSFDWGDGSAPTASVGGLADHTYPENVFRAYTVRITASDGRGGATTRDVAVEFAAPPENQAPTLELARIISKTGFEVLLSVSGSDPDDDGLSYTIQWGDGTEDQSQGGLSFHAYPDGQFRAYTIRVLVEDGRGGSDSAEVAVDFPEPVANRNPVIDDARVLSENGFDVIITASATDADDDAVALSVDWGDGSDPVLMGGGLAAHSYPDGVFDQYTVVVTADDGNGGVVSRDFVVEFEAPPPNEAPVFEFARVINKDGFDVVISVRAVDPEGGAISYSVDWDDGSDPTVMQGGIADHAFADGRFRAYTVRITATDPDGGATTHELVVNFPRPADNQAPTFEFARVTSQVGFEVVINAQAADPDNDVITYTVDWGDGSLPVRVQGGLSDHTYLAGQWRAYVITITADDGNGGSAQTTLDVAFVEPVANRPPVFEFARVTDKTGFNVVISASATDADGNPLSFTVDWGDGSEPTQMGGGDAEHAFPADVFRGYAVTITVTDGEGGSDEAVLQIEFPRPADNHAPEFEYVGVTGKVGFEVTVRATAFDPDQDNITYTFDWGDGSEPTESRGGEAGHVYPEVFRAYTVRVTASDAMGGQASRDLELNFPAPAENAAPIIDVARILSQDGQVVLVSAHAIDPDGDVVEFTIDWGDGSEPEAMAGGLGEHAYPEGGFGVYEITITATDGNGGESTQTIDIDIARPADNNAPVIEEARVLPQGGFEALAMINATDADGDALTYTIDWGDGSEPVENRGGVAAHGYAEGVYATYTVTITVTDVHGTPTVVEREIDFPEPVVNAPPVIDGVNLDLGLRGEVILTVTASDPEGGLLVYIVHWGDERAEAIASNLVAGTGSHIYGWQEAQLNGWIEVRDPHGNATRETFTVVLVDNPTRIHDVHVEVIRGRQILATVIANDADGTEDLIYTFDFDDDAVFEVEGADDRNAVHTYPADGDYTLAVQVRDPWSGAVVTRRVNLRIGADAGEAGAPLISDVRTERGIRGWVDMQIDAWDPNNDPLTFVVDWGDGSPAEVLDNNSGRHRFQGPGTYEGWVEVRDNDGHATRREVIFEVEDHPTVVERIVATPVGEGAFALQVFARDEDGADVLVYSFDFESNGTFEAFQQVESSSVHQYRTPGNFRVTVMITDQWSGETISVEHQVSWARGEVANQGPVIDDITVRAGSQGETQVIIDAYDPDGEMLFVAIHWGDENEGILWPVEGLVARHRYAYPGLDAPPYPGYVVVTDTEGASARMDFDALIVDRRTIIHEVVAERIQGGQYVLDVRAHDPDGDDRLVYAFDWTGDGTWDTPDQVAPAALHTYDLAGTWAVRVRVTDTWSGVITVGEGRVSVRPWENDNGLPVIHGIRLEIGLHGHVILNVEASDPDGQALDYAVHWGDEPDAFDFAPMGGVFGEHDYAWGGGAWDGYVLVTDVRGSTVRGEFTADLVDTPSVIRSVNVQHIREGSALVDVQASDADGEISYRFDFDNDGTWDVLDQGSNTILHAFPEAGAQTVRVGVTDTWSGLTVEGEGVIELDPWVHVNAPPVIHDLSVVINARGHVELSIEASDPEGAFVDATVHWGDEDDAEATGDMVGHTGDHHYAWPGLDAPAFQGFVVVTDPEGLEARMAFEALIVDAVTVIRTFTINHVRDGQVQLLVQASDADTDTLSYSFDLNGQQSFEVGPQAQASHTHTYEQAGTYAITVRVTDDWSGVETEQTIDYDLAPWVEDVPIAEDHLEGEEGRCLVFRIAEDSQGLSTKVDPTVCEREVNPDQERWSWDFGDGSTARGSEVGHVYRDDGVYDLVITGGTVERPQRSSIQVVVVNSAPEIITEARTIATAGEAYRYALRVRDQGPTDEVRMELVRGPEGMVIGRGDEPGQWIVAWDVPEWMDGINTVEVEVRATDGHLIEGEWADDGGEAVQNFEIRVNGLREPSIEADFGVDAGPNAGFDGYTGSSCSCDVTDDELPSPLLLLGLLALGLVRRRQR